jgi:hypothetical protein
LPFWGGVGKGSFSPSHYWEISRFARDDWVWESFFLLPLGKSWKGGIALVPIFVTPKCRFEGSPLLMEEGKWPSSKSTGKRFKFFLFSHKSLELFWKFAYLICRRWNVRKAH